MPVNDVNDVNSSFKSYILFKRFTAAFNLSLY